MPVTEELDHCEVVTHADHYENTTFSQSSLYAFNQSILPHVSRTFALTIPQLPHPLDGIVTNAYLLCRIADTIEDDVALTDVEKVQFQMELLDILAGDHSSVSWVAQLEPKLSSDTPEYERELILQIDKVVQFTRTFSEKQQAIIKEKLAIMCQGMAYFAPKMSLSGLKDIEEFDFYCYAVAGVVGELLTELFIEHCQIEDSQQKKEMLYLSVSFGQALQMTNILKDMHDDWLRGTCWLPQNVFSVSHCCHDLLHETPQSHLPAAITSMVALANTHCQNALQYVLKLPRSQKGIRRFCLWALGLAQATLKNIASNTDFKSGAEVKVSRSALARIIAVANIVGRSNVLLRVCSYTASSFLPAPLPLRDGWEPEKFRRAVSQR